MKKDQVKFKEDKTPELIEAGCSSPIAEMDSSDRAVENNHEIVDGRFETVKLIGEGGMGKVFQVRDLSNQMLFALKLISSERMNRLKSAERFQKEWEAVSRLEHPNIARVREYGTDSDGRPFLLMDYLEGTNLQDLLASQGSLDENRAQNIISAVCRALNHAHEHGVVHRDIKPSNVFLTMSSSGEEVVKVLDFGIAGIYDEAGAHMPLTETGEMLGTPWYMSPEQCFGKTCDERSDIYQVGCLYHQLLTGNAPFPGGSAFEVMFKHVTQDLETGKLDGKIGAILARALDKNPDHRFQSMSEFIKALELAGEESSSSEHKAVVRQNCRQAAPGCGRTPGPANVFRRIGAAFVDALLIATISSTAIHCLLAGNMNIVNTVLGGIKPVQFWVTFSSFVYGFLDALLVWPMLLLSAIPHDLRFVGNTLRQIPELGWVWQGLIPFFLCLINWAYHVLFECSALQATPGKLLAGLRVQTAAATRPSLLQSSIRHFSKVLSTLLLPEIAKLLLAVRFRRKAFRTELAEQVRRPLYDKAGGCVVVPARRKKKYRMLVWLVAIVMGMTLARSLPVAAFFLKNYDLSILLEPKFLEAYQLRAKQNLVGGRFKDAVADLSKAESLLPAAPENEGHFFASARTGDEVDVYAMEAAAFYQLHDYSSAISTCTRGESHFHSTPLIPIHVRILAFSCGDFKQALDLEKQGDVRDRLLSACLSRKVGQTEESKFQYEVIAGLHRGKNIPLIYHVRDAKRKTAYGPDSRGSLEEAIAFKELGNFGQALSSCANAINDALHEMHNANAAFYMESGEYPPLHSQFVLGSAHLLRGQLLDRTSRKAEATGDYERSVEAFSSWLTETCGPSPEDDGYGSDLLEYLQVRGQAYQSRAKAYERLEKKSLAESDRAEAARLGIRFDPEGEFSQ